MPAQYPARSSADFPDPEARAGLSGLDMLTGIRDGRLAGSPLVALLYARIHHVTRGEVSFRGTPEFVHGNVVGTLHGGWYGALLDSCLACAVWSMLDAGQMQTTLEFGVNLIRAVPFGTEVEATGTVRHCGRSTAVATAEMRGVADNRLYATGSTTCIILSGR